MTLKRQLLLASLLMLLIPWAGIQFVVELDQALREQAQEQLEEQGGRLKRLIETWLADYPAPPGKATVLYAQSLDKALTLDGYGSDWPGYNEELGQEDWHPELPGQDLPAGFHWQAAADDRYLYLQFRIPRPSPILYNPAVPDQPYDYLSLRWVSNGTPVERMFRTTGQGAVDGLTTGRNPQTDQQVNGHWLNRGYGYRIELRLPRPDTGSALQFGMVNTGENGASTLVEGHLVTRLPELKSRLWPQLFAGQRAQVLENGGWLLATAHRETPDRGRDFDSLGPVEILEQITLNGLSALVSAFQPEAADFPAVNRRLPPEQVPDNNLVRLPGGERLLMVTHPLEGRRTLVLQQSLERILALSGNTLGSVIARSTLLIIGLMLVLLGYASWLSWRITRLQRAIDQSVDEDGRILARLAPSRATDEIGTLSRRFSHMIDRLEGYTQYLESFSRRLAHELKTPVAVVRSSLENLGHVSTEEDRENYLSRAQAATQRLSRIIHGMSEASRLEQSLDHAEKEVFDLAPVVSEATGAYRSLDPDHDIRYQGPENDCPVSGSPELLVQMLDKLVDNARDFTPAGGQIVVSLSRETDRILLSVTNEGSQLPEQLGGDIFNPFVSLREQASDGHLGQGLLIVRLIAEHHRGEVGAENLTAPPITGVRFQVRLPAH